MGTPSLDPLRAPFAGLRARSRLVCRPTGYLLAEVFGSGDANSQVFTYDDDGKTPLTSTWTDGAYTASARYPYDAGQLSHVNWEDDEGASTEDYTYSDDAGRVTLHAQETAGDGFTGGFNAAYTYSCP